HLAGTYDGSAIKIYLNGNLESTLPWNNSIYPGHADLGIGGTLIANSHWKGSIDEPALYNRALSASEIQAIYNAAQSGKCGLAPTVVAPPQSQRVKPGTNVTFKAI